MATYMTSGFVLNAKPWRERDRLYTILTEHEGKVEVIAAGSRKLSSKLAPHLAPFGEVEVMVARGKQLDRLAGANVRELYLRPPYQLSTAVLGSALLEVADVLTRVGEPEPKLHQLLGKYLRQLAALPIEAAAWRPAARWLLTKYMVEVLRLVGLAVPLTRCEYCRGALSEPVDFSWAYHGFLHHRCLSPHDVRVPLPSQVLGWLTKTAAGNEGAAGDFPEASLTFVTDYVTGQAGRELYTLKVLRSIL